MLRGCSSARESMDRSCSVANAANARLTSSSSRLPEGSFVGPAAPLGVGVELADVGELVAEGGQVFGAGHEVSQVSQMLA
jgi:hypothetical protein